MLIYLLMLTLISLGANFFAIFIIRKLLLDQRVTFYDARGYLLLVVLFLTFAVTSLAYFWGEVRFSPVAGPIGESLLGVFFSLACNLGCLMHGFIRLRHSFKPE